MSLGRIMVFGVFYALATICPLPAASCCGPTLDVARYVFEPPRNKIPIKRVQSKPVCDLPSVRNLSNLLAGSRHLAAISNDIFGFNGQTASSHPPQKGLLGQAGNIPPSPYLKHFFQSENKNTLLEQQSVQSHRWNRITLALACEFMPESIGRCEG